MQRSSLIGVSIAVVFLFFGVTVAPSLTANANETPSDNELVKITTEICGIHGIKPQTVQLTKQQADEVEKLIDGVKIKLHTVQTREDRISILHQAVTKLDKYGLLGNLTVEQAQKLIEGGYENSNIMTIIEKLLHKNMYQTNQGNLLCFIVGIIRDGYVTGQLGLIGEIIAIIGLGLKSDFVITLGQIFMGLSDIITSISPLSILQRVTIYSGNIVSLGLGGLRNFNISVDSGGGIIYGFNGIKIKRSDTGDIHLLGFALGVRA